MQENKELLVYDEGDERGLVHVSGCVEHVIYANEENGYLSIKSIAIF